MSLYAIGDLHLHYGTDRFPDLQKTDPDWVGHEEKVKRNCARLIRPEDTLVLVGDHTWGKSPAERRPDFEFIEALPGRKILTRGNHDMFWEAKRTDALRQRYEEMYGGDLEFLQGSFAVWNDYALVATKGYTYEGLDTPEHAAKLVRRELVRRPISSSARAASHRWLKTMASARLSTRTATAAQDFMTASAECSTVCATASSPATASTGARRKLWMGEFGRGRCLLEVTGLPGASWPAVIGKQARRRSRCIGGVWAGRSSTEIRSDGNPGACRGLRAARP